MAAASQRRGDEFLVDQFREFYQEVLRFKRQVTFEDVSAARESAVGQGLLSILERHALVADRLTELQARMFREAQYVMASLADEVFLHLDWRGRESWTLNLLEAKLFESQVAGERFFDRLDGLLRQRDPAYTQLAKVYLLALGLGFEGKYRGTEDRRPLEEYRQRIYQFIEGKAPGIGGGEVYDLFPAATGNTIRDEKVRLLPSARNWVIALAIAMAAFVALSHLLWSVAKNPIEQRVEEIRSLSQ